MVRSDPVDFECPDCGFAGPAYFKARATVAVDQENDEFLSGNTIGPTPAETEARARARGRAREMQVQAVTLAPCPVCERVSDEVLVRMKRELIKEGFWKGLAFALVWSPLVGLFLESWRWGLGSAVFFMLIGAFTGVGDLAFFKRRGREVSFEPLEPEPEEDEVERWFEALRDS
ncbi:MAG: hypothetical protein AB7S68_32205 [Polyangiaceae bacterium]